MIQSGIFPENQASVKLHTGAGLRVVGTRERIGQHGGMWCRSRGAAQPSDTTPLITTAPRGWTVTRRGRPIANVR